MHKQRKIAFLIAAATLVAAIVFTVIGGLRGWYGQPTWLSSLVIVLWIVAVIALFQAYQMRTYAREKVVRRFYLSPEYIYNHEIGYSSISQIARKDPYAFVLYTGEALAKLTYGLNVAAAPDQFQPTFLVENKEFEFHFIEDDEGPQRREDQGVVIDTWSGTVNRIEYASDKSSSNHELGTFVNATELAMLLDVNGAFDGPVAVGADEANKADAAS